MTRDEKRFLKWLFLATLLGVAAYKAEEKGEYDDGKTL